MNIDSLVNNLESRRSELFITVDVKKQLTKFVDSEEITESKFFEVVHNFFQTSLDYAKSGNVA
jgi:hypothetical protein